MTKNFTYSMSPSSRRMVPITNLSSDGVEFSSSMASNSSKRSTVLSLHLDDSPHLLARMWSNERHCTRHIMMGIGQKASMSYDVPSLTSPHIVKYNLRPLMRFIECTCGFFVFHVGIVISTSDVQRVDII